MFFQNRHWQNHHCKLKITIWMVFECKKKLQYHAQFWTCGLTVFKNVIFTFWRGQLANKIIRLNAFERFCEDYVKDIVFTKYFHHFEAFWKLTFDKPLTGISPKTWSRFTSTAAINTNTVRYKSKTNLEISTFYHYF